MSLPVDRVKSDAARAQGNTSFKKGRWAESIGHYTNAVLHNPEDPLAYCNRAQAYLRLDKYDDAERDCTTALLKQEGNIKALYRRALARKGLERYAEAASDLNDLLALDKGNETATEELQEIEALRDQQMAAKKAKPKRPLSPPRPPATAHPSPATANIPAVSSSPNTKPDQLRAQDAADEVGSEGPAVPESDQSESPDLLSKPGTAPSTSSFAALRTARAGKKSAYISPSPAQPATPSSTFSGTQDASISTIIAAAAAADSPAPIFPAPPPQAAEPTTRPISAVALKPPADPNSTAPGTGILLLRTLAPLSPASAWSLLRLYPPANIPVILGPILEPDTLGNVLAALAHGSASGEAGDVKRVGTIMAGLKETPRIGMNAMMLDQAGAEAAQTAWRNAGGNDTWP